MKYDVSGHTPSRIETLLAGYEKADVELMERSLENLKNIIKDKKFIKDIEHYDTERHTKIMDIQKKAINAARELLKKDDGSTIFIDIEEIKQDMMRLLEESEKGYWNAIKDYVTLYMNKEETEEENDE